MFMCCTKQSSVVNLDLFWKQVFSYTHNNSELLSIYHQKFEENSTESSLIAFILYNLGIFIFIVAVKVDVNRPLGWWQTLLGLRPRHHRRLVLDGDGADVEEAGTHRRHSSLPADHHLRHPSHSSRLAPSHHPERGHQRFQQGFAHHHDVQQCKGDQRNIDFLPELINFNSELRFTDIDPVIKIYSNKSRECMTFLRS
jgi:hypothetical protein